MYSKCIKAFINKKNNFIFLFSSVVIAVLMIIIIGDFTGDN